MNRAALDQLLARDPGAPARLLEVLSAASAPPQASELAGENAAMADFRAARKAPRHAIGAEPGIRSIGVPLPAPHRPRVSWLVAAKIGGATFALAATGFAMAGLAIGTGLLPLQRSVTDPGAPGTPLSVAGTGHLGDPVPTAASTGSSSQSATPVPSGPGASPSLPATSLAGLCHAYQAQIAAGHTPGGPAFDALYAAAGGAEQVEAFCTELLSSGGNGTGTGGTGTGGTGSSGTGSGGSGGVGSANANGRSGPGSGGHQK